MITRHFVAVIALLLFAFNPNGAFADSREQAKSLFDITCSANMIAAASGEEGSELDAQFHLANNYLYGICREQSVLAGITILKANARSQHQTSAFTLAEIYYHGKVVKRDLKKATELYRIAANSGNPVARTRLGTLLLHNPNSENEVQEAFHLLRQASEKGDLVSSYHLYEFLRKRVKSNLCGIGDHYSLGLSDLICDNMESADGRGQTTASFFKTQLNAVK